MDPGPAGPAALEPVAQHGDGGWAIAVRCLPAHSTGRVAAQAHVERAVLGATFDLFHASTDAYAPLRHERMVFATGAHTWIVADRLAGPGRHRASVHWHIDPEWAVAADGPRRLGR